MKIRVLPLLVLVALVCWGGSLAARFARAADRYAADRALAVRQRALREQQGLAGPPRRSIQQTQPRRHIERMVDPRDRDTTPLDDYEVEQAEYDRKYATREPRRRVAPTAHYDLAPVAEEQVEVGPVEWEEDYEPSYNGAPVAYDVFEEGSYNAIDGNHYQQTCDSGCPSGCTDCGSDACGGSCGGCFDRTGFGAALWGAACDSGLWVRADYLLWWMKGESLPPLVTTSPDETPRLEAGVLGEPGTQIVYGDQRYLNEARSGGRIEFGGWLDHCQTIGIGGGFFGIGEDSATYANASAGEPIIARPFFSTLTNAQDSALTAYSSTATGDLAAGAILARTSNDLLNANAFLTRLLYRDCGVRWDALAGYRFTRFDEDLAISEFITVTENGSLVPRGTTFDALDSFDVSNQFNGGDLGVQFESQAGRWALNGMLKIGLGSMYQQANIWGRTIITEPGGAPDAREGDILAMPSNIGSFSRSQFAYVPEARLNISFLITPTWRVTAGYTFIYWSEVIRAGQLVDTTVNPTQLLPPVIGPERPTFTWVDGDLWAQGLNVGTELRY